MNNKKIISKMTAALLLMAVTTTVTAQTYNHDASVYNQFLVGETGGGSLTPGMYYNAVHRSYQKWASLENKNLFRGQLALVLEREKPLAEQIDSALTYRARIEAMNVADRTPKALDLAWQAEKGKIEKKFQLFRENINKITMKGGSSRDYRDWLEIYNCLQTALKAVRDAYLPLNERKRQYLEIYHDLVLRNQQLVQYVTSLSCGREADSLLSSKVSPRYVRLSGYTSDALGRWKVAMAAGVVGE